MPAINGRDRLGALKHRIADPKRRALLGIKPRGVKTELLGQRVVDPNHLGGGDRLGLHMRIKTLGERGVGIVEMYGHHRSPIRGWTARHLLDQALRSYPHFHRLRPNASFAFASAANHLTSKSTFFPSPN